MRNHNEKVRDMARSVLPSKARVRARRYRRRIHHGERAQLRDGLFEALRGDPEEVEANLRFIDKGHLRWMVNERQGADKVGPLIHWVERTIATSPRLQAMTPQDRETYFRSLLPNNLIGAHAITHLDDVLGLRRRYWYGRYARPQPPAVAELEAALDRIVAAGAIGELNGALKALRVREIDDAGEVKITGPTLLAGAHDRDRFVNDLPPKVRATVIDVAGSL